MFFVAKLYKTRIGAGTILHTKVNKMKCEMIFSVLTDICELFTKLHKREITVLCDYRFMEKASCGYSPMILASKSLVLPLTPKIFTIILFLILQTLLRELLVRNAMSDVLNPNFTNTHT